MKKTDIDNGEIASRRSNLLEEMNAVQVRKNIDNKSVAVIVLGACENHGDHMPFGSDFIFPMELAKRIAIKSEKKISLFFRLFHMGSVYIIMNFK